MSAAREQRREPRKFKRIFVRYGNPIPSHRAVAQQISTVGLFLLTNETVYAKGSQIAVEIAGPAETWVLSGIVRHAFKVHPSMTHFSKPGMCVELTHVPPACRDYLASL